MASKSSFRLPNSLRMGLLVAALVGLLIGVLAWFQVERERLNDLEEMDRRAYVLAHQMAYPVQVALQLPDSEAATTLGSMLEGYRRLIGLAIYRADGRLVAAGKGMADFSDVLHQVVGQALAESKDIVETRRTADAHIHLLASVIRAPDGQPQGALAVLHDLVSLDERATHRQALFGFWIGFIVLSLLILTVAGAWLLYDRPLNRLAEWMRQLRAGEVTEAPSAPSPFSRLTNESDRLAASLRVARLAQQAQARAVMHVTNAWTRDRLRAHVVDCLRGGQLLVVSNREPYMHELREGKPRLIMPAGGLVTALDPVLQACGGVWVAHGSGEADRQMADAQGRLAVPPDDPTYTLRRVWLTREEEQGYYYGFANEGLWPLCHLAHERPIFRASDWEHYMRANRRFAEAALEEAGSGPAVVLVQDYQTGAGAALPEGGPSRSGGRYLLAHPLAQSGGVPDLSLGGGLAARHVGRRPDRFPPPAALQQFPRHRGPDDRGPAGLGSFRGGTARPRLAGAALPDQRRKLGRAPRPGRRGTGTTNRRTQGTIRSGSNTDRSRGGPY